MKSTTLLTIISLSILCQTSALSAQVPHSKHIVVVPLENHSYEQVINNSQMPYFNSLANKYGIATQYYANQHGSLKDMMWLVAGAPIVSSELINRTYSANNLARRFLIDARTWRSYAEKLPYTGYSGLYAPGDYYKRHNPLAWFSDVANSQVEKLNLVNSVPHFLNDVRDQALPNYSMVVPAGQEDAHDGSLAKADAWLKANIAPLLASPEFGPKGDGILFIVWDEGKLTDTRHGGGRVATLVIGPKVKHGYRAGRFYHHQDLLRTVCTAMQLSGCPGAGATGAPMKEFFHL